MYERDERGIIAEGPVSVIANEFTTIEVRAVTTPNGKRLEVTNPKTGHSILLDAMQLEILTVQEPERFNNLFSSRLDTQEP
jgi:hypothetical protein